MGTFFDADLRVRPDEVSRARAWLEWARAEIARLEAIYSRHDPASVLSRLNLNLDELRNPDEPIRLDADLESILIAAIEVGSQSAGAFDVTIGPVVDVWRVAAGDGRWPSSDRLREARRRVGSEKLLLRWDGQLVTTASGLRIDLDGLSKGAVLDRLRQRFELEMPSAAALLSFGESSVVAIGAPEPSDSSDREGWSLVVRSRDPLRHDLGMIRLRDRALSVSSSLGSVVEIGDRRISHVVDPRTGTPVEGTVESIVIADRAERADAWSTALLVLGANAEAMGLAENAGLDALVFDSSGRSVRTSGFDEVTQGGLRE
jgi:thiamine biosynthesis lipoprotein